MGSRAAGSLLAVVAITVTAGVLTGAPRDEGASAETLGTLPGVNFYPRLVRLSHSEAENGVMMATTNNGVVGRIWRSDDDGESYSLVTEIDPGPDAVGLCCIELFEFPVALGPYPAGTLLWSGSVTTSVGPPRQMELRVFRSDDRGATWMSMSSCASSLDGGLWEPAFHVARDGSLVCTFADESDRPAHSQLIARTVSTDGGQTWGPREQIVAGRFSFQRPGMATVAQVPDGGWLMTYELCGWRPSCAVRILRSADGLGWGPVEDLGDRVVATDGSYLAHTPYLHWTSFGGGDGTLILSGQLLFDVDGQVAPGNGATLFINDAGGVGPWTVIDAPVAVPDAFDNFCPNYSSPVIDLDGTGRLVEMASAWSGPECITRFGTGSIPPPAPTTTTAAPNRPTQPPSSTTSVPTSADAPVAVPVAAAPQFTD